MINEKRSVFSGKCQVESAECRHKDAINTSVPRV